MVIVRRANLMSHALLSCLDSLPRSGIDGPPDQLPKKDYECVYNKTCVMAARYAALTGGDSALVRHFQSINWIHIRPARRMVLLPAHLQILRRGPRLDGDDMRVHGLVHALVHGEGTGHEPRTIDGSGRRFHLGLGGDAPFEAEEFAGVHMSAPVS